MFSLILGSIGVILVLLLVLAYRAPWDADLKKSTSPVPSLSNRFWLEGVFNISKALRQPNFLFHTYLRNVWQKFGKPDIFSLQLFGERTFIVNTPDWVEDLLSTGFKEGRFAKGNLTLLTYRPFLGEGIFNSNGDRWKQHREFASKLFHASALKSHLGVFDQEAQKLCAVLSKASANGQALDLQAYLFRLTSETFSRLGFGVQLNGLEEGHPFQAAFDRLSFVSSMSESWGDFSWLYQRLDRSFARDLAYVNDFVSQILRVRRLDNPKEATGADDDLLSRLLEREDGLSDLELRDWIVNFLIAGRDTTATLLTWTLYELARNPEVEAELLEELRGLDRTNGLQWEEVAGLRFTKRVLQESLRLHPPLPIDGFAATQDQVTRGVFIKKDSQVIYSAYFLGRSPEIWGPDYEEFRPDRFLESPKPFTFLAFHGGPRVCLGQEMAYLEAKVVLAQLLLNFRIELDPTRQPQPKAGVIMTSENGLWCSLQPRQALSQN